ncbi:MAG: GAF domain-containing protein, partial [Pseudomonadota bacterium]
AALHEILDVISRSREDEAPVLAAIVRNAARLCRSPDVGLHLVNEARTHTTLVRALEDDAGVFPLGERFDLDAPLQTQTAIREARIIHIPDVADDPLYLARDPIRVKLVEEMGVRSRLSAPLLQDGVAFGCINLARFEVRPFTDDEIALIETFAAQAVIAIENVRQFRALTDANADLAQALERQTASAEVLDIVSRSHEDARPVFEAMLASALRLCGSRTAMLLIVSADGERLEPAATIGGSPQVEDWLRQNPVQLSDGESSMVQALRTGRPVHVHDIRDTERYRRGDGLRRRSVDEEGTRTVLQTPLMLDGRGIGVITAYRDEVRPYTDGEIELLRTFAAQAVIALENVRQFRELQTRLEREAATREILEVISTSRDDEAPVFDAILEAASRLLKAKLAFLTLADETRTRVLVPAHRGTTPEFGAILDTFAEPIDRSELVAVLPVAKGEVIRIDDMKDTDLYRSGEPRRLQMVDVEGVRSVVGVPLMKGGAGLGALVLYRRDVAPFSDDDVALLESFAAQAVIAIENVRQFREVQERLEREKASAEVLEVISRSRDDQMPVFEAILERAARLCGAHQGGLQMVNEAGDALRIMCNWGEDTSGGFAPGYEIPLDAPINPAVSVRERRVVNIPDLRDTDLYRQGHEARMRMVEEAGVRSWLIVPMLSGETAVGSLTLSRREVKPFTPDEVALVETFAAQAVIAIENVRQFRELQTRLEREAATREILEVISSSRDDEAPVFDAILNRARRLCGAVASALLLGTAEGGRLTLAAFSDAERVAKPEHIDEANAVPMKMDPDVHIAARAICSGKPVHVADLSDTDAYRQGEPSFRLMVDEQHLRSTLSVPLLSAGRAIGAISLHRRETVLFSADEVALVESFAAQAVIAIENVRQFKALEALNAELGDRVEEQVGEIERMGRLKRFLSPQVAQAITSAGAESKLTSHRAMVAVLFADIRGFTAFCERAEPEETIEVLQTYHEEMGRLLHEHGAGVDHRSGDGIMAIFNDPLPCEDPAGDAVRLALAMRARMTELCRGWRKLGHRLGFGVGVSLGYATVGMVGSEGRYDYTASGTAVNLGARLCDRAADGEILLSPRAAIAVEDDFAAEAVGEMEFKGIREPVDVFRLIDPAVAPA